MTSATTQLARGGAGRRWPRRSRRRGATWTLLVIVISTTLLAAGSMYMRASTHPLELAADQSREVASREAAFAGVRWAAVDARRRGPGVEGGATLQLAWGTVEVQYRPVAPGAAELAVTSRARAAVGPISLRVSGVLVPRDDALVLDSFTYE